MAGLVSSAERKYYNTWAPPCDCDLYMYICMYIDELRKENLPENLFFTIKKKKKKKKKTLMILPLTNQMSDVL